MEDNISDYNGRQFKLMLNSLTEYEAEYRGVKYEAEYRGVKYRGVRPAILRFSDFLESVVEDENSNLFTVLYKTGRVHILGSGLRSAF